MNFFDLKISTGNAGLFTIEWGHISFHFFVKKEYRSYGYDEFCYDRSYSEFGIGPIILITWETSGLFEYYLRLISFRF